MQKHHYKMIDLFENIIIEYISDYEGFHNISFVLQTLIDFNIGKTSNSFFDIGKTNNNFAVCNFVLINEMNNDEYLFVKRIVRMLKTYNLFNALLNSIEKDIDLPPLSDFKFMSTSYGYYLFDVLNFDFSTK